MKPCIATPTSLRPLAHCTAALALALACCGSAQAQFSGAPAYSLAPSSQLGPNTGAGLLTLSTSPYDISITGQLQVTLAPGPASGSLAVWRVDRPLLPSFTLSNFTTVTDLIGFSAPPVGTFGASGGTVRTYITDLNVPNSVIAGTLSQVPLSLVNGAAVWSGGPVSSPVFSLTTGSNYALRQVFDLDGVYTGGPGGVWVVDVPLYSSLAAVPEPASLLLWAAGMGLLAGRLRGRRQQSGSSSSIGALRG